MLPFNSDGHLTLGVEVELQLLDKESLDLTPVAIEVLGKLEDHPKIKSEIFQSMAEINTAVCQNIQEVEHDLRENMQLLQSICTPMNVLIASAGTHPFARYSERKLYPAERYVGLIDRNQWIARRLSIFGMHIHLGMRDPDTCIRFNNFFLRFVPHLLAMTASSPFWQGDETGLASCRTTIFESSPTAGHPCRVNDWQEFSTLCDDLMRTKAITDMKDIWWDIRPSPKYGTMEIRACDGPATLQETIALTAFVHALAHWYDVNSSSVSDKAPPNWIMRENKWRATRHGLDAELIDIETMELTPIRDDIRQWLERLAPHTKQLGYEKLMQNIHVILDKGASYMRQSKVFKETGSLQTVALHNAREFEIGEPIY